MNEKNPYECPSSGITLDAAPETRTTLRPNRVFIFSYCASLAIACTVVVLWLLVVFNYSSVPPSQRRTSPPDIVEWIFLFIATLPSVLTCLLFSFLYCSVVKVPEKRKRWPAVLFGAISGLIFNAMTAIWVIEHLFDW